MDRQLIEEKLELLRRFVRRIEDKRLPSVGLLKADHDAQDIVTANLTRAVQICVDITAHVIADREVEAPASMAEAFEVLARLGVIDDNLAQRMRKAVGFRNIAVHNYQAIDWGIVHAICHKHMDDFRQFAAAVSKLLTS